MSDIAFVTRHSLPLAKARAQVQKAADALAAEHDLSSEWHGNTLHFHRTGVHGLIHVSHAEIRLEAKLSFLLKPFKAAFLSHIERNLHKYLPEPELAASAKKPAKKATPPAR
jgi:putative polyhydroxyalkanoate system protein